MERWYSHESWNSDYSNRGRRCRHSFHTFFDGEFPGRHYLENLPQNTLLHSHNKIVSQIQNFARSSCMAHRFPGVFCMKKFNWQIASCLKLQPFKKVPIPQLFFLPAHKIGLHLRLVFSDIRHNSLKIFFRKTAQLRKETIIFPVISMLQSTTCQVSSLSQPFVCSARYLSSFSLRSSDKPVGQSRRKVQRRTFFFLFSLRKASKSVLP